MGQARYVGMALGAPVHPCCRAASFPLLPQQRPPRWPVQLLLIDLGVGGLSQPGMQFGVSIHTQVRELHLIHRDGVALWLAVTGRDGAGGAWRGPATEKAGLGGGA